MNFVGYGLSGLIPLLVAGLFLVILYWVIKKAIRTALIDHYKTVRLYEHSGEWQVGPFGPGEPRKFDGTP